MVYGIGNNMIKLLMFIANLALFIGGAVIFGFSLWANVDNKFAEHFADLAKLSKIDTRFLDDLSQYQASLWVLVAVGALLLVVGFLGCCGAGCESPVLLTLFFVVVLILSLIELFTLVFLVANRGELLSSVHKLLQESSKTETGIKNLLPIEKALHCCGATAESAFLYKPQCDKIPELVGVSDCYTVLSAKLESTDDWIMVFGIALLIVQAFALIFSCVLTRAFRERGPAYYG